MNVYAPTEQSDDVGKEWFYQIVEGVDESRKNYDIKMVIRDLNARLGRRYIQQIYCKTQPTSGN